jgi:hypothetical protein
MHATGFHQDSGVTNKVTVHLLDASDALPNALGAAYAGTDLSRAGLSLEHHKQQQAYDPEPELLLVFGSVLSCAGFPPWMLRVTEMYHAGHLQIFTPAKLHDIIHTYQRTWQRSGA